MTSEAGEPLEDPSFPEPTPGGRPRLRVAAVGTLWREVGPLARRLRGRKVWKSAGRRFVAGRLGEVEMILTATGEGSHLARLGVEMLLQRFSVDRLIMLGVAGGLTPDLEAGAVVVARQVLDGQAVVPPPDEDWVEATVASTVATEGTVVSATRIASDAAEKKEIWRRSAGKGSGVVDLESAAIARAATARRLPYLVIRAVSDTADESLPLDFERFRDRQGKIAQARVAFRALCQPTLWPSLMRLRTRVNRCAEKLADVVEEALRA